MCLAAIWLLAVPAAARAAESPSFKYAGTGTGPAQTDLRYAAWSFEGSAVVLDTTTGSRTFVRAPERCAFAALGAGRLLWDCGYRDGAHRARVQQIATGAVIEVSMHEGDFGTHPDSVGSDWIHSTTSGNHYSNHSVWSRIDGTAQRHEVDRGGEREIEDLSDPALVRPLCAPLARERDPDYDDELNGGTGPFFPYQYEPPFGLRNRGSQILLSRCGHTGSRILERRGGSAQLLAGWVSWVRGWQVRGYFPARKRKAVWDVDAFDPATQLGFEARHTKRYVVVSSLARGENRWQVAFARVR
jgi:hypothetical protein